MSATVLTTIRWEEVEIQDIKTAAKQVGLPVSLFIKTIALSKVRNCENLSPTLTNNLLKAKQEIENNEFESFSSAEDFLKNLKTRIKK